MLKTVLQALNKQLLRTEHIDWLQQLDTLAEEHPSTDIRDSAELLPQYVVRKII